MTARKYASGTARDWRAPKVEEALMSSNGKLRVYTIVERVGGSPFWLRLGNAVPHKDGKGFSMNLQAVPVSGLIVVRQYDEEVDAVSLETDKHERVPELVETA